MYCIISGIVLDWLYGRCRCGLTTRASAIRHRVSGMAVMVSVASVKQAYDWSARRSPRPPAVHLRVQVFVVLIVWRC